MNILVTGASGFVGSQVVTDLIRAGHDVTCCVRNTSYTQKLFPQTKIISCDFIKDTKKEDWLPRLADIDVVINTVGIFYHPLKKIIWAIHYAAPKALFDACVDMGVQKIIHISALGVDRYTVDYAKSKLALDEYLSGLKIPAYILRPSLVYGEGSYGGTSLFRGLAGLPLLVPLPGSGEQKFQPIHSSDLSRGILNLIKKPISKTTILSAVGVQQITLKEMLKTLRSWLGFSKPLFINVPAIFIRIASWLGDLIPYSTINTTGYKMLLQDNVATETDTQQFIESCGFTPKSFADGIFNEPSRVQDRWHARLYFMKPLLQLSLAFLWLFTALTSAFLFPKTNSYHWLSQVGVASEWQPVLLYGASLLNAIFGLALLLNIQVRKICILQIVLILVYTLIISWKLPLLWLEPFGPITKNLPLLVAIMILYVLESDR